MAKPWMRTLSKLCIANLQQWSTVFAMYSAEQARSEMFPPMTVRQGSSDAKAKYTLGLVPDPALVYPDYLSDPAIYFCTANASDAISELRASKDPVAYLEAHAADQSSYIYFGYAFDKMDLTTGWTVPVSVVHPALDYFGLPLPEGDLPIPAQGAAWLLQLAENAQMAYPPWSSDLTARIMSNLFQGDWDGFKGALRTAQDRARSPRSWRRHFYDSPLVFSPTTSWRMRQHSPEGRGEEAVGIRDNDGLYRMSKGVTRWMISQGGPGATDAAEHVTYTMFERLPNESEGIGHSPTGSYVLYLDGHIEYFPLRLEEAKSVRRWGERGWSSSYFTYPANDPMRAPQPINIPMQNFVQALRGEL